MILKLPTPNPTSLSCLRALSTRVLASALCLALLPLPELFAQSPVPMMLHINILEGEEALNNVRERTAREPIVQVEDSNHKPVAGVVVVFTSIRGTNGAGGTFNSFTEFRTVTNAEGKAVGRGFQPNTTAGQFTIQVTATLGAVVAATAVIHETNSLGAASESSSQTTSQSSSTSQSTATTQAQTASTAGSKSGLLHAFHAVPKWVLVGVVAGAAAAVTVAVTQTSGGTTITTGAGTVGAPTATRPTLGQ